jgi:hypothetical protein
MDSCFNEQQTQPPQDNDLVAITEGDDEDTPTIRSSSRSYRSSLFIGTTKTRRPISSSYESYTFKPKAKRHWAGINLQDNAKDSKFDHFNYQQLLINLRLAVFCILLAVMLTSLILLALHVSISCLAFLWLLVATIELPLVITNNFDLCLFKTIGQKISSSGDDSKSSTSPQSPYHSNGSSPKSSDETPENNQPPDVIIVGISGDSAKQSWQV